MAEVVRVVQQGDGVVKEGAQEGQVVLLGEEVGVGGGGVGFRS